MSDAYDPSKEGFFQALRRQVREDHAGIRERNANREAVWRQSPAMRLASNLLQGPFGHEPVGEEEHGIMLLRTAEAMKREPLVRRYLNHIGSNRGLGLRIAHTEWWHALGHQYATTAQFTQARTLAEAMRDWQAVSDYEPVILDTRLFREDGIGLSDIGPREFSYEWMGRVMRAMTYLWHQNTYAAAVAAPLVPHVVQPNALPFDDLFFSFERAAFITHGQMTPHDDEDAALGLTTDEWTWSVHISKLGDAGMALVFDRTIKPIDPAYTAQHHIVFEPIPWGSRWPEDLGQGPFAEQVGAVLRMLAFMQAPFVDATTQARELPRLIRKDYKREGKSPPLKQVSIITLRAKLYEPTFVPNGDLGNGSGRVYQHSWWVNGHYRWQWYPSTQDHKLVAIAPYMKQIGKPLLPQIRDVSR